MAAKRRWAARFSSRLFMHLMIVPLIAVAMHASADSPATLTAELRIEFLGRAQTITLADLRKKLKTVTFTVDDPAYQEQKTYEGFWLLDVLRVAGLEIAGGDELEFRCADDYKPTVTFERLLQHKAMLAFRDKDRRDGWEKLKQGNGWVDLGPFYVVWDTREEGYPWPYQVIGLTVISFTQKYAQIVPKGHPSDGAIYRGYEHFRTACMRCHSLNLQGGTIGPELNVPKNITEYRDPKFLVQFIQNPGNFRAGSKMPSFATLSEADVEEIIEYLRWMKNRKQ